MSLSSIDFSCSSYYDRIIEKSRYIPVVSTIAGVCDIVIRTMKSVKNIFDICSSQVLLWHSSNDERYQKDKKRAWTSLSQEIAGIGHTLVTTIPIIGNIYALVYDSIQALKKKNDELAEKVRTQQLENEQLSLRNVQSEYNLKNQVPNIEKTNSSNSEKEDEKSNKIEKSISDEIQELEEKKDQIQRAISQEEVDYSSHKKEVEDCFRGDYAPSSKITSLHTDLNEVNLAIYRKKQQQILNTETRLKNELEACKENIIFILNDLKKLKLESEKGTNKACIQEKEKELDKERDKRRRIENEIDNGIQLEKNQVEEKFQLSSTLFFFRVCHRLKTAEFLKNSPSVFIKQKMHVYPLAIKTTYESNALKELNKIIDSCNKGESNEQKLEGYLRQLFGKNFFLDTSPKSDT